MSESPPSPPEADEIQLGATGLAAVRPPMRTLKEARRQAKKLMREVAEMEEMKRKCRGRVKLRGPDGEHLRDASGVIQTRPCKKQPIRGGAVCPTHGGSAPQVKKKAERRLNAMLEPAIVRMDYLMHQDEHLPTALAASLAVQNRVLGGVGKEAGERDTRPIINIGIMPGGVPAPVIVVSTKVLQRAKTDEADAEVIDAE